jgi:hypothetical protein
VPQFRAFGPDGHIPEAAFAAVLFFPLYISPNTFAALEGFSKMLSTP